MSSLRRTAVAYLLALLASTAIADALRAFAAEPATDASPTADDVYLSLRDAVSIKTGWGVAHDNASATGGPLRIGSVALDRGIGTHAPAELVFRPSGKQRWLTCYAGISAEMTEVGSAVVQVWCDKAKVYETPVLRVHEEPRYIAVPIADAREVRLVVTDAGNGNAADHVNLANLRFCAQREPPKPDGPLAMSPAGESPAPKSPWTLWYRRPASRWIDGMPVGNGRVGAVQLGGVARERVALNESTVWSGAPSDRDESPTAKKHLPEIRRLLFAGDYVKARDLCAAHLLGRPSSYGTHLPMADLLVDFQHVGHLVSGYRRWLDLDEAVARVEYSIGDVRFTREVFASHPDGVLVVRIAADKPGGVSFTARLDGGRLPCEVRTPASDTAVLSGNAWEKVHSDGRTGVGFECWLKALPQGGEVRAERGGLRVQRADAVVLLVAAGTTFRGGQPAESCREQLRLAAAKSFDALRRGHVDDHRRLMRRVSLDLGGIAAAQTPTDVRMAAVRKGRGDPQLAALFFQYGRYLLIAGSRADSPLPTNLQGIWNDNLACNMGWTCDFHLDINTQQNYWPAEVGNLSECHEPLLRLVESLPKTGRRTAERVYGARGWVAHTITNAWGYTAPGWGLGWGLHPTAGVWIASHLWQHYEYTGDAGYLRRRAYPVLKEAAEFCLDFLVEHPTRGWLVTGPADSPENAFRTARGEVVSESMGPTCDRVLIADLFTACIEASKILGIDAEFRAKIQAARAKLPPLQIGKHGQLQEWLDDFDEPSPNHRHTTHLLALYPGWQITPRGTPALAEAARATIRRRIERPDWEDVEWSRGNLINFYARLADGDNAHKHIEGLLREDTSDSLLTFSRAGIAGAPTNIFCIDGNSAGTAGIAEMLLQSHGGELTLLPALPKPWSAGSVRGLRARGGFEVDLVWNRGRLSGVTVTSVWGTQCRVRYGNIVRTVSLCRGGRQSLSALLESASVKPASLESVGNGVDGRIRFVVTPDPVASVVLK